MTDFVSRKPPTRIRDRSLPPKKQFSEVVEQMVDWADKALEKVAEKKRAEERQRAEARKKRSGYCR